MKQNNKPRIATAALFAAVVLPIAPVHGQEVPPPVVAPPPPVVAPPPPVTTAPPPAVTVIPAPAPRAAPPPRATPRVTPADEPRAEARRARTPARRATPAPSPAPVAEAAPPPAAVESVPPATDPALNPPPPVAAPAQPAQGAGAADLGGISPWAWILALFALAAAAIALFTRSRRRAVVEDEQFYLAPTVAAPVAPAIEPQPYIAPYVAPVMVDETLEGETVESDLAETEVRAAVAADAKPAVETLDVGAPAEGDVAAMSAASEPGANRPWLEMLMRPLRAGTTSDDAVVEFELTVGNTGSEAARDVRISAWMFPAGADGASEMERLLIDSESSIEPGGGTRVSAAITMSKAALSEAVLPVVVADARYRLADGSEGRTAASFAVGMPSGDELAPFPVDRSSGLLETVEARLHGDLERD